MPLFISLLTCVVLFSSVYGDLPVHCLQSETVGDWEFVVNQDIYPFNIRDKRVSCGNGFPNQYLA